MGRAVPTGGAFAGVVGGVAVVAIVSNSTRELVNRTLCGMTETATNRACIHMTGSTRFDQRGSIRAARSAGASCLEDDERIPVRDTADIGVREHHFDVYRVVEVRGTDEE